MLRVSQEKLIYIVCKLSSKLSLIECNFRSGAGMFNTIVYRERFLFAIFKSLLLYSFANNGAERYVAQ